MKLEPFINIYSGEVVKQTEENRTYHQLLEVFRDPDKMEKLKRLLTE